MRKKQGQTIKFLYDSGAEHFVGIVPDCELTWGDASLWGVEEDVQTVITHDHGSILKRLAVTDSHTVTADFAGNHLQILAYPMDFLGGNSKTAA